MLFKKIFFGLIGLFGITGTIYIFIYDPEINALSDTQKYLFLIISLYTSIVLILVPNFIEKNWIVADYHDSDKYEKAKSNLFTGILLLPTFVYFFVAGFMILGKDITLIILLILILSYYISSVYTLINKKYL